MNILSRLQDNMANRYFRFCMKHGLCNNMPDEEYLRKLFRLRMGYEPDLAHPKTFNEKIQWLKIHDRRPEYTMMVDKYAVKDYVAKKIGAQYVIPTLGVWNHFDEIDFSALPEQFVLKCTHDSGSIVICRDKENFDRQAARKKLEKNLCKNYYWSEREWPYKDVPPRIIAEPYMDDAGTHTSQENTELLDYKFMCFHGKVKCSFVCSERFSGDGLKVTFFDIDWKVMPFERHYPRSKYPIPKPFHYEEMVMLAEELAKDIPFVRVDFYEVNVNTYFGELTFSPGGGFEEFTPFKWDRTLGDWIELSRIKHSAHPLMTRGGVGEA